MSCRTLHEAKQMSLPFQIDSTFRTHSKHQGHLTITFEDTSHPKKVSTNNTQAGLCLPCISRVLQEIHEIFHENS